MTAVYPGAKLELIKGIITHKHARIKTGSAHVVTKKQNNETKTEPRLDPDCFSDGDDNVETP